MPRPKTEEKIQARRMYVEQGKAPAEIATLLSVSESTVWGWIKKHDWKDDREQHLGGRQSVYEMASRVLSVKLIELQDTKADQITPAMLDGITKLMGVVERAKTEVRLYECAVITAEEFVRFVRREVPDEATRAKIFGIWDQFLESVKE